MLHNSSVTIQNRLIILGLKKIGYEVDVISPKSLALSSSNDPSLADVLSSVSSLFEISPRRIYEFSLKLLSNRNFSVDPGINARALPANSCTRLRARLKALLSNFYDYFEISGAAKLSMANLNINLERYGLIISSSDPKVAHIIADKLLKGSERDRPRWIQYWGDPWFQDITLKGIWKKPFVRFLERKLLEGADKVVYASPLTLEKQRDLYPDLADKMTFAHQATEAVIPTPKKVTKAEHSLVVSYVGDYNPKIRHLRAFLDAARFLPNLSFKIVGLGKVEGPISGNVELIQKRLPLAKIRELELTTDIFFAVCNKRGTQIPAKIYYLAGYVDKPIIVALDGEYKEWLKTYLESFERYILCNNDVQSITETLAEAIRLVEKGVTFDLKDELKPETMVLRMIDGLE